MGNHCRTIDTLPKKDSSKAQETVDEIEGEVIQGRSKFKKGGCQGEKSIQIIKYLFPC